MKMEFLAQDKRAQRLDAARPAGRPHAALCVLGLAPGAGACAAPRGCPARARCWRRSPASTAAARCREWRAPWHRDARAAAPGRARGGALRRHVQQLAGAGEPRRRGARAARRPATASRVAADRRRAPAVLRPHLPRHRHGGRGARRGAPHARGAAPVPRARRPDRWASSPPASSRSATSTRRCCPATPTRERLRGARCSSTSTSRAERRAGRCEFPWRAGAPGGEIRVHGHCHQKAFGTFEATLELLRAHSRREGRGDRVRLLRDGGHVRLRARPLRRVDEDGRAGPAAGGARGAPARASSRRARAAATRSRTARGARPCIRWSCSRRRCERARAVARGAHAALAFQPVGTRAGNLTVGARRARRRARCTWRWSRTALASGSHRRRRRPSASARCCASSRRNARRWCCSSIRRARRSPRGSWRWAPSARLFRAALDAAAAGAPVAAVLGRNCYGGASMLAHLARARLFGAETQLAMSGPSVIAAAAGTRRARRDVPAMAEAALSAAARAKASARQPRLGAGHRRRRAGCARRSPPPATRSRAFRLRHEALGARLPRAPRPRPRRCAARTSSGSSPRATRRRSATGLRHRRRRAREGGNEHLLGLVSRKPVGRRSRLALRRARLAARREARRRASTCCSTASRTRRASTTRRWCSPSTSSA